MSLGWSGAWLVSHMVPWQPAMGGCDLDGEPQPLTADFSHVHMVIRLLAPAEAHSRDSLV